MQSLDRGLDQGGVVKEDFFSVASDESEAFVRD
jgi:hypothetical protein